MVHAKNAADSNSNSNSFSKTICSICYEDFKPLIEDLQCISVCGHVFHELCLQQWFEYCPDLKKRTCPICKQKCTNANVGRLYFQSVGDSNDSSLSQKPPDYEGNPEELQKEVNRLEGKALALTSTLEQQQKDFKEVKNQFLSCKEQLKHEVALKNEFQSQVAATLQTLRVKSEEHSRLTLEHKRLQERNMALAKELAALKLASDLNLEEDEITKLASLGNEIGSRESIDVLRKSLVIRNKSYKELMAKCNVLGRGEAQSLRKLEKANEKIKKLKLRVHELETAVEIKENEVLRGLKDHDNKTNPHVDENAVKRPGKRIKSEETSGMPDITLYSRKETSVSLRRKNTMTSNINGHDDYQNGTETSLSNINQDNNVLCSSIHVQGFSGKNSRQHVDNSAIAPRCHVSIEDTSYDAQNDVKLPNSGNKDGWHCSLPMGKCEKEVLNKMIPAHTDDDVICYGDANSMQTPFHIRKETGSHIRPFQPGGHCFSGGLLGPDGTNWHLGKWCKKGQKGSTGSQESNVRSGDLIAVGADGRGGRIKVMRSIDQLGLDVGKKCKSGPKPIKLQGQGHLQIEHFFQRRDG